MYNAAEAWNHAEIHHVQIGYANTASRFCDKKWLKYYFPVHNFHLRFSVGEILDLHSSEQKCYFEILRQLSVYL
jgi:hypothetical protein